MAVSTSKKKITSKKHRLRSSQKKSKNHAVENFSFRLQIVFFSLIFFALAIVANLFVIQILRGSFFREQAEGQYISSSRVFERGKIFFRGRNEGLVLAAGQEKGYKLVVNPQVVSHADLKEIFPYLKKYGYSPSFRTLSEIIQNLKAKGSIYYEILHSITDSEKEEINSVLKGKKAFRFYSEKWRVYPFRENAAQMIGFLSYGDDGKYRARYGLEKSYDSVLLRNGKDKYANIFALIFRGIRDGFQKTEFGEGDLVTNVDPQVQIMLQSQVDEIQKRWNSERTGVVVMDAQTGAIYGMASVPSFDPNRYKDFSLSTFRNSLVSDRYEFGSVMKPLVMAIALDKGYLTEETSFFDSGSTRVGKYLINNFDKRGRGWVTMQDVLDQSLNTGMVFVSKKIPKKIFREYFKRYGFTEKSGIDLPYDALGLSSNLKSNRDIEFANMSFGQGIAVSPISFIKAASALAHGGTTVQPHVGKEIRYSSGMKKLLNPEGGRRVFSEETAERITRMLVHVFDHYHGGKVKFPHHSVAAKTGTAQMADPKGGYYENRHLHSFLAYFPAYDPKFIVFLYTVDPKGAKYSSQTLIEPFRNIARFLIHYYEIPPDR